MFCYVLFYSVLFWSVLFCSVLFCFALLFSVLLYSIPFCSIHTFNAINLLTSSIREVLPVYLHKAYRAVHHVVDSDDEVVAARGDVSVLDVADVTHLGTDRRQTEWITNVHEKLK